MEFMTFVVLAVFVYPFIAAWLVGANKTGRINSLEREVGALERALATLRGEYVVKTDLLKKQIEALEKSGRQSHAPPETAPVAPPETEAKKYIAVPNRPEPFARRLLALRKAGKTAGPPPQANEATTPVTAPPQIDATPEPLHTTAKAAPAPSVSAARHENVEPHEPTYISKWLTTAITWLLTGNLVAKLGLVILFIGIAFLLKYVAATITIPIELRLAGVVLADLGLLAWGWRLRGTRREIGLPVQGTAIAILMLVIFGAHQRYDLIPAGFAFALLVCLTAFTCLLAVLQDAPWLAAFGITGGFACPLLLSTGQGNHVALFSYYALLNAGVFALSITRSWRPLNLLGFAFTFVVGSAWGNLRYIPENYPSAQGFLILFFLCYVAISLAFAYQQQARLKNYVDATLVLGTPLLAFGLQVGLVQDKPFGIALSALALGGFYLTVASILIKQGRERWRVMLEAYAALGVIFGTLAMPFALDGRWTSAVWALEGAGFVWLGLRWQRPSVWVFGLLLQVGASVSFFAAATALTLQTALSAHLWLGCLLLAASAFAIALTLRKNPKGGDALTFLAEVSLTLSAIWLLAGCWTEAILHTSGGTLANWMVASALLTALLLYVISARLDWPMARQPASAAQMAAASALGVISAQGWTTLYGASDDAPLLGIVMLTVAALITSRLMQRAAQNASDSKLASLLLLWAGIWWFGPALNVAADRLIPYLPDTLGTPYARWSALYALGVVLTSIACMRLAPRLAWPQLRLSAGICWSLLLLVTAHALHILYVAHTLLDAAGWIAWAVLWSGSEYLRSRWSATGPEPGEGWLKLLHLLRSGGPWLALGPSGAILIERWLIAPAPDGMTPQGWVANAAWSNYLPTWAMMLALALLLRRSVADKWPAAPLGEWYRTVVIPAATLLMVALAVAWNLSHDGAMQPLPYLPLLNPLDLTTGFVLMLWASVVRQLDALSALHHALRQQLRLAGLVAAYLWFNLILLRSAAQYLDIAYRLPDLAASQFVQAMMSLVWSASALVLMRMAARRAMRRTWWTGAAMLGIVVLKLFAVDLGNSGSIARVVSFVGVGLLLLLVGYFAPYPKHAKTGLHMPPAASA